MTPDPTIVFAIAGAILLIWGVIVAIFNEWASRWGKRMQRIYGQRASDMVTPRYLRVIGIFLAAGGAAIVVLGLLGAFKDAS